MRLRSGAQAFAQLTAGRALIGAVIDVLSDVKDIETLQRANDDAEQRKAALDQDISDSQAALDALRSKIQTEQATHTQNLTAQSKAADDDAAGKAKSAQQTIVDANAKALQIVAKANSDASDIVATAQRNAQSIRNAVTDKEAELTALEQSISDAREHIATLQGQLAAFETQRQQALARLGA